MHEFRTACIRRLTVLATQRGSATVEYVSLALVVSMLLASIGSAIDSATGERVLQALVRRMLHAVEAGAPGEG